MTLRIIVRYPNNTSSFAGMARTVRGMQRHAYAGSDKPFGHHWHAEIQGSVADLRTLGARKRNGAWTYRDDRGNTIPCTVTEAS